ncbi:MAG TPA: tRNA preQ1(34) S-adenosylmethionine ribosyltransferase-isomerase QueA [Candidatus Kryptonia bacterium]
MKLTDFKYAIPRSLIAKSPAQPRDHARLMVLDRKTQQIEEKVFYEVSEYFQKGDSLVVNETKVFPARLLGRKEKTNAKIEVLLLRELNHEEGIWDVVVEPARKVRIGNKIYFDDEKIYAEVIDNTTSRGRTIKFNYKGDIYKILDKIGQMPLPNYIKRDATEQDKEDYQTIYARVVGAVAAPTAGLHFSKRLITKLEKKGVKILPVVLHIGIGTFRTVDVEDLTKHRMDSEYFEIPPETAKGVNDSIDSRKNIFAVGTSVVRVLESNLTTDNHVKSGKGWTDKFIYPPYEFKVVDHLVTNFHLPETTLIMLVSAFAGHDFMMRAYKKATKESYRFYSYGDAMLIL